MVSQGGAAVRRHGAGAAHEKPVGPGLSGADRPATRRGGSPISSALDIVVSLSFIGGLLWLSFFYQLNVHVPPVEQKPFDRRTMYLAAAAPGPEVLWAAGSFGRIIRSEDGGKSWAIQATNSAETLQVLIAWNEREAVAAGENGAVLRTEDAGRTWSPVPVELREIGRLILSGAILPGGRALLAGEYGMVLASDDKGRTWRHVHPPEDVTWHALGVTPTGRVLTVGEFGRVKASNDGGETWVDVATPADATLTALAVSASGEVVAAGLGGGTIHSADGGATFTAARLPNAENVFALGAAPEGFTAIGDRGSVFTLSPQGWSKSAANSSIQGFVAQAQPLADGLVLAGSGVATLKHGMWSVFQ